MFCCGVCDCCPPGLILKSCLDSSRFNSPNCFNFYSKFINRAERAQFVWDVEEGEKSPSDLNCQSYMMFYKTEYA